MAIAIKPLNNKEIINTAVEAEPLDNNENYDIHEKNLSDFHMLIYSIIGIYGLLTHTKLETFYIYYCIIIYIFIALLLE